MKKITLEVTKEIYAGASYSGNIYYVAGIKFNCSHSCKGGRIGHNVTGNSKNGYVVTHICTVAP
ncbi:hypothetical protein ACWOFR_04540 [Carnobacterium gallinarum]|uniref:hypothetical protein n=1 Tax=Carnobacterium gallinarum TaxID=2749 RepID=UPI00054D7B16|nr:hypothetical protein [Carnobacterium gallinarum]